MSEPGSVTGWIVGVKAGDADAAQQLWQRYYGKLVGLARKKLWGAKRRVEDEEDVASMAINSFCLSASRGRFPKLQDRNDLWRLLLVITSRKAIDLVHRERRDQAIVESALPGESDEARLERIIGKEPTPEFAHRMAAACRDLLAKLDTDELRFIAVWKMEGYSNEEIAGMLGCALATVERRLRLIRKLWEKDAAG